MQRTGPLHPSVSLLLEFHFFVMISITPYSYLGSKFRSKYRFRIINYLTLMTFDSHVATHKNSGNDRN